MLLVYTEDLFFSLLGKNKLFIALLIFNFVIFASSCANPNKQLPIDEDLLVELLADIHLAEAAIQREPTRLQDSLSNSYYRQIFDKYKVEHSLFDSCLNVLFLDEKRTDLLYDKVLELLRKREINQFGNVVTEDN